MAISHLLNACMMANPIVAAIMQRMPDGTCSWGVAEGVLPPADCMVGAVVIALAWLESSRPRASAAASELGPVAGIGNAADEVGAEQVCCEVGLAIAERYNAVANSLDLVKEPTTQGSSDVNGHLLECDLSADRHSA